MGAREAPPLELHSHYEKQEPRRLLLAARPERARRETPQRERRARRGADHCATRGDREGDRRAARARLCAAWRAAGGRQQAADLSALSQVAPLNCQREREGHGRPDERTCAPRGPTGSRPLCRRGPDRRHRIAPAACRHRTHGAASRRHRLVADEFHQCCSPAGRRKARGGTRERDARDVRS